MKLFIPFSLLLFLIACANDPKPQEDEINKDVQETTTDTDTVENSALSDYEKMFRIEKRKEFLKSNFKNPQIKPNIFYVFDSVQIYSDANFKQEVGTAQKGEVVTLIETTNQFDINKNMFEGYVVKVVRENEDTVFMNDAVLLNLPYDAKSQNPKEYFYNNLHLTDSVRIEECFRKNSDEYPDNEEGEYAEKIYSYEKQIEFSMSESFVVSSSKIILPNVPLLKSLLFYNHIPNIDHPPILSLTKGKLPTETIENITGFESDISVSVEKDGGAIQSIYYMFGFDSHFIDIQFDIFEESGTLIQYSIGM